jgi:hypothetical protein
MSPHTSVLAAPHQTGGTNTYWRSTRPQGFGTPCVVLWRSLTRTMKGNSNRRCKGCRIKTQTVYFSKVDPLYKCQPISFSREMSRLLHFRNDLV